MQKRAPAKHFVDTIKQAQTLSQTQGGTAGVGSPMSRSVSSSTLLRSSSRTALSPSMLLSRSHASLHPPANTLFQTATQKHHIQLQQRLLQQSAQLEEKQKQLKLMSRNQQGTYSTISNNNNNDSSMYSSSSSSYPPLSLAQTTPALSSSLPATHTHILSRVSLSRGGSVVQIHGYKQHRQSLSLTKRPVVPLAGEMPNVTRDDFLRTHQTWEGQMTLPELKSGQILEDVLGASAKLDLNMSTRTSVSHSQSARTLIQTPPSRRASQSVSRNASRAPSRGTS